MAVEISTLEQAKNVVYTNKELEQQVICAFGAAMELCTEQIDDAKTLLILQTASDRGLAQILAFIPPSFE